MANTYLYPTNTVLNEIEPVLAAQLQEDDLLFQLMPIDTVDAATVEWEQEDDWFGLQQIRGYNGEFPKVQPVGAKGYRMDPGVYGEHIDIQEKELTTRRPYGQFTGAIDIGDLVLRRQNQLLSRRITRIKYIGWTLLGTGTFAVANNQGAIQHTDTFPLSTYALSAWGTPTTATPLADLRAIQLLGPAQGTSFDNGALAIMNRTTANLLLANTNAADLGGKRTNGLANVMSMPEVNQLLTGEGLPNIAVYDDGYKNDAGTFTRYIPNNTVIIVGRRPGNRPVANYIMTRNANRPDGSAGPYMSVYDSMERGDNEKPPRLIQVFDSHNGAPAIYYPGSIVKGTF